jgi:hypothetical protein
MKEFRQEFVLNTTCDFSGFGLTFLQLPMDTYGLTAQSSVTLLLSRGFNLKQRN